MLRSHMLVVVLALAVAPAGANGSAFRELSSIAPSGADVAVPAVTRSGAVFAPVRATPVSADASIQMNYHGLHGFETSEEARAVLANRLRRLERGGLVVLDEGIYQEGPVFRYWINFVATEYWTQYFGVETYDTESEAAVAMAERARRLRAGGYVVIDEGTFLEGGRGRYWLHYIPGAAR